MMLRIFSMCFLVFFCVSGLVRLEFMAVFKVVSMWIGLCFIFESYNLFLIFY